MDVLPIVLTVVVTILTVVLSIAGIQLIMVLMEVKKTLTRVNDAIDTAEEKINSIVTPFQNLGGMTSGLSAGFKVFETFVGWLQRNKER